MIPFQFEYYAPDTLREAHTCYARLKEAGKDPVWYAGGTELISMARVGSRTFGAVVDLKGVPECTCLEAEGGRLVLGAALTLTRIHESGAFPLLGRTAARIADHTIQNRLTLGGNLAGTIQYREAALPLLLCDCTARVMTGQGVEKRPFTRVFDGKLTLRSGEFLVAVDVSAREAALPHSHAKRTKLDKIDYPLATLCAVRCDDAIRAAVTGYGAAPFLLPEAPLNAAALTAEARSRQTCAQIAAQGREDLSGSREYKLFVVQTMVADALSELGVK